MQSWQRKLITVGIAAAVVALVVWLLRPQPVRVSIGAVERGPFAVTVEDEGYTRVRDRFVVTAPVAGRVARIALDAGDAVKQGAVLTRMNPLPLDQRTEAEARARLAAAEAQQRAADAQVALARAGFEQAQRTAARARRLRTERMISAEELEMTELTETQRRQEHEAAVSVARAAAFAVEAARAALIAPGGDSNQQFVSACEADGAGCIALRAPIDGQVLRISEKSERVVAAGTPLLELGDTERLELVVDVLSADAVQIQPGAKILLEQWGGATPLHARVRLVEPSGFMKLSALGVEEQRVNVIGDFIEPPPGLSDGYRVEARIVIWQGDAVLKVAATALFRRGGEWQVYAVEGGRARRRGVQLGRRSTTEAQVLAGLEAGELVILHPSDQVEDGVRVEPL